MQSSVRLGKVYDMLIEKKLGSPNSFRRYDKCNMDFSLNMALYLDP